MICSFLLRFVFFSLSLFPILDKSPFSLIFCKIIYNFLLFVFCLLVVFVVFFYQMSDRTPVRIVCLHCLRKIPPLSVSLTLSIDRGVYCMPLFSVVYVVYRCLRSLRCLRCFFVKGTAAPHSSVDDMFWPPSFKNNERTTVC